MGKIQPKKLVPIAPPPPPATGQTPTISLAIIVKNESKVIKRMLDSVYRILDYYVVVDTGSTDGTQDMIRDFFKEKNIPGEVIEKEWTNFEDCRNFALEKARDKADFGFWIDADEQLILADGVSVSQMKRTLINTDGANIEVLYGGQKYYRMQLYSNQKPWRWYGPLHEVLVCDGQLAVTILQGATVLVTPDGNSWTSESLVEKYNKHAKLLEEYVANDEKKDPRWLFYLAQSYRDTGTDEGAASAIEWYKKRLENQTGFWEELYFSQLMIASLKARLKAPASELVEEFLKCGKLNRLRIEHLMPLIQHYHNIGDFDSSYLFSLRALQISPDGNTPAPTSSLFIDTGAYEWNIFQLHFLNAYHIGKVEEARSVFQKLVDQRKKGKVPQFLWQNMDDNAKVFAGIPKQK